MVDNQLAVAMSAGVVPEVKSIDKEYNIVTKKLEIMLASLNLKDVHRKPIKDSRGPKYYILRYIIDIYPISISEISDIFY